MSMSTRFQCVILAVFLMLGGVGCGDRKENKAGEIARNYVKDHLLAPSTAQFNDFATCANTSDRKFFIFYVEVDAQNAFGAMLRKGYLVLVRIPDTDGYDPWVMSEQECSVKARRSEVDDLEHTVPDQDWDDVGFQSQ